MQKTQFWSLGREVPPWEEMANPPSILAFEIPWTDESGRLWSTGSKSSGHNLATKTTLFGATAWFLLQFYLLLPLLQNKVKTTSNMLVLRWKSAACKDNSEVHCFKHRLSAHNTCSLSWNCQPLFHAHAPSPSLHNLTTALSHLKYFHLFFHLPSYLLHLPLSCYYW